MAGSELPSRIFWTAAAGSWMNPGNSLGQNVFWKCWHSNHTWIDILCSQTQQARPLPSPNMSNTASSYRRVLPGPPTWNPAHPLEHVPLDSSVSHLIAGCEFNTRHLSKYTNRGSVWRWITWGDKGCAFLPGTLIPVRPQNGTMRLGVPAYH